MTDAFGIDPETELERRIVDDPEWREGAAWGQPRRGHPEGRVADHIREVLTNLDRSGADSAQRLRLRVIALVHDTFKHRVRSCLPGRGDHAMLARRFAERHTDDQGVLDVVELHDEAYRAWRRARRTGDWKRAERRAEALMERLGEHLPLFLAFYRADNETGDKAPDDRRWFESLLERRDR